MTILLTICVLFVFFWFFRRELARIKKHLHSEGTLLRSEFELLRAEGLPSPPPNGFNINRRPDTLRRLRSSQSIDTITASTGWSLPEVILLKKIEALAPGRREQES